jgi:hypothetical protein
MTYRPVTGTNAGQMDMSGSVHISGTTYTLATKNADGLWSTLEELGMYCVSRAAFSGTFSATFESLDGTDTMAQGGLMIRASLKSGAPYAAIRLVRGLYDPVARPDSVSNAKASGSTVQFQKGDLLFLTCLEKERSGNRRVIDVDVGAKRNEVVIMSKKYTITTLSDSVYVGMFYADRSTNSGSFAVSNVKIQ